MSSLPVWTRAIRTAPDTASAPVLKKRAASICGLTLRSRLATYYSNTGASGPTTPSLTARAAASVTAGCAYPNDTAPRAIVVSTYSRPSESHTLQPSDRTILRGARGSSPNISSGRLLPVDVNPGITTGHPHVRDTGSPRCTFRAGVWLLARQAAPGVTPRAQCA